MQSTFSPVLQPIILRTSTPPASEKVGVWVQSLSQHTLENPPAAESNGIELPSLDPDLWVPPRSERVPSIVSQSRSRSPARSNHTARLNEELNEGSGSIPDYGVDPNIDARSVRSNVQEQPRSEAAFSHRTRSRHEAEQDQQPDPRHISVDSMGSFGNLLPPRESTFGPMVRKPGETPAFAQAIPLPGGSVYSAATPSIVDIQIEGASDPPSQHGSIAQSHVSRAPSHVSRAPSHVSRAPSHVSKAPTHVSRAPSQTSRAPTHVSRAPSHVSHKPPSEAGTERGAPSQHGQLSQNLDRHSRNGSVAGSYRAPDDQRALSPERVLLSPRSAAESAHSRAPTNRSRAAPSVAGHSAAGIPLPSFGGTQYDAFSPRSTHQPMTFDARSAASVHNPVADSGSSTSSRTDTDAHHHPLGSQFGKAPSVAGNRNGSVYGTDIHARELLGEQRSQKAPSMFGGSQAPSFAGQGPGGDRAPSIAEQQSRHGTQVHSRAPSVARNGSTYGNDYLHEGRQPEQSMHGGSQFGRSQAGGQHPGSNYAGSAYGERPQDRAAGQHSAYGGSRYAPSHASDARLSNVPDRSGNDVPLHPLTAHARSVASNQGATSPPYNPTPDQILHAAVRGNAVSPNPSQGYQHSVQSQPWGQPNPHAGISENSRGYSPDMLDEYEQRLVDEVLIRTPRTSYTIAPSALAAEVQNSHFHDGELCLLLHAADDPNSHDVVRRAMRKAIKSRLKKLGLKHDNEAVNSYRLNHTTMHQPAPAPISASPAPVVVHMQQPDDVPPAWARDMFGMLQSTQDHLERLDSKLSSRPGTAVEGIRSRKSSVHELPVTDRDTDSEMRTPKTVTVQIRTAGNNTNRGDSVYRGGDTEGGTIRAPSTRGPTIPGSIHHHDGSQHHDDDEGDSLEYADSHAHRRASQYTPPNQDFEDRSHAGRGEAISGRDDSPGQQYLAEELYKLRIKPTKSERSHNTWEITREEGELADTERVAETESEMIPEIPDTELQHSVYEDQLQPRTSSPAQAALPVTARSQTGHGSVDHAWETNEWSPESESPPPWQRIHQRLLNWAIVWPMSELDQALNSTLRGHQVNEVALSIWATQTYKRYVRSKMMDHPRQTVDRLFVPPNMADAINNAVFNGRHGDACGMLRDLWTPFGLQGMPRLLVVLARHRKEENHWVVHRFSLPDGGLTTFDSFPERALPDGRPLGWWFAIRIAWPHAMYPSPDHLVQKIVRLHRPLQLVIDNSVASAGVWRNALMGSRAERSVDLERLRDLINNEVKNLRQRKEMGKLSITAPRPNWEEIAAS